MVNTWANKGKNLLNKTINIVQIVGLKKIDLNTGQQWHIFWEEDDQSISILRFLDDS